ncbi:hypothetical protein HPNQ4099_0236 [Helicobacter pylori NQ4099]|uniref:Uncharacterized protein n=1 Tax=Helicobacter pylori NQ4099 TaxID=992026 RepID=I9QFD2_HELPX|nr:hypothetical protein HPNQ4099_0236 [Helicobacter pylori NQ4099]
MHRFGFHFVVKSLFKTHKGMGIFFEIIPLQPLLKIPLTP